MAVEVFQNEDFWKIGKLRKKKSRINYFPRKASRRIANVWEREFFKEMLTLRRQSGSQAEWKSSEEREKVESSENVDLVSQKWRLHRQRASYQEKKTKPKVSAILL